MPVDTVRWEGQKLYIIDQTLLPTTVREIQLATPNEVWEAIKSLRVRGAPAIGVCAAFGVLVGVQQRQPDSTTELAKAANETADYLATSRPTAVNLFWALDCMRKTARDGASLKPDAFFEKLEAEAVAICEDDKRRSRAIGDHGANLIRNGDGVLTHCNAGGLATAAYGTALAVMFSAHEQGTRFQVFVDETRPLLQGARLTSWELMQAGIETTLICDNAAAQVMREGRVQLVVVGADRIAANGDTANKIGTYNVALVSKAHNIPFYVAAPFSTFDMSLDSGEAIPIEQRDSREVTNGFGKQTAPDKVRVYNPAFDVTPAELIAGIITELGVIYPPYRANIVHMMGDHARTR